MVGVPGKSKGCHTCRKRKIRCDLQRPECGQCLKSNRSCTGYQREVVFKVVTGGNARQKPQAQGRSTSPTRKVDATKVVKPTSTSGAAGPPVQQSTTMTRLSSGLPSSIPQGNTFQAQFFQAFMDSYLPDAEKSSNSLSSLSRRPISWLQIASQMLDPTKVLSSALITLSVARIGRLNNDDRLSMEARILYGKALTKLQAALWDKSLMYTEETLVASMALGTYELLECPGNDIDGWIAHTNGTSKLIQLRGPQLHKSALANQLFEGFRLSAIIQAVTSRKRIFLEEPDWLTVPCQDNPRSMDDRLIDFMTHLPGLFEQVDNIKELHDSQQAVRERLQLVEKCWDLWTQIKTWHDQVNQSSPQYWPIFSTLSTPVDSAEQGKVFPIAYEFPNIRLAVRHVHYWGSMVLLYSIISLTYASLEEDEEEGNKHHTSSLRPLPSSNDDNPFTHSINIAQSVEYFMRSDMGSLGGQMMLFPLRVSIECFRHQPVRYVRELNWCSAAFDLLCADKGLPFSRYIVNTKWGYRK